MYVQRTNYSFIHEYVCIYIYTRSADFRVHDETKREDCNRGASVREQTSGKKNEATTHDDDDDDNNNDVNII
jgi:hypothetical protein